MSYRIERINELIKNELNILIGTQIKDPRVNESLVSVVRVNTTADLKYAKVYVSVMEDNIDRKNKVIEGLDRAKGFLRKSIAKVLNTRYTPELVFVLDESLDYALRIDEILEDIHSGKNKGNNK